MIKLKNATFALYELNYLIITLFICYDIFFLLGQYFFKAYYHEVQIIKPYMDTILFSNLITSSVLCLCFKFFKQLIMSIGFVFLFALIPLSIPHIQAHHLNSNAVLALCLIILFCFTLFRIKLAKIVLFWNALTTYIFLISVLVFIIIEKSNTNNIY